MDVIRLEIISKILMKNVWSFIIFPNFPYKENLSQLKLGIIIYLHLQGNTCLIIKPPTMPDKMLHEILFLLSTTCHVFRGDNFLREHSKGQY